MLRICFVLLVRTASRVVPFAFRSGWKAMALSCLFGAGGGAVLADPPAVSVPPANATNCAGGTATFSVTASGIDPLSYQWYLNATTAVAGATSATLSFTSVQSSDAGNYTVVVSNDDGSGSTTSSP